MKLVTLLVGLSLVGCMPGKEALIRDARMVANASASVIEAGQDLSEIAYEEYLRQTIVEAAKVKGATKATVRAAVAEAQAEWVPTKKTFKRAREAHRLLVMAIKAGESADVLIPLIEAMWEQQKRVDEQVKNLRSGLDGD